MADRARAAALPHFSGDLFLAFSTANPGGITTGVTTFRPGAAGRYDRLRLIPWGFPAVGRNKSGMGWHAP